MSTSTWSIATVPIGFPRNTDRKLAFRALARSQFLSVGINYGFKPVGADAVFPIWEDAYSIGVRFNGERSDIFVDGKDNGPSSQGRGAHPLSVRRRADRFLDAPPYDGDTAKRRFMREISDDLEVPYVTHLGRGLFHVVNDQLLLNLAQHIHPYFDAPETLDSLLADHFIWTLDIYIWCASSGAAILCGSVLHAKLTPRLGSAWSAGDQASTGSAGRRLAWCGWRSRRRSG